MAFLLMDFRPLKATFEKLFMPPILEKRLNHDAIRTKIQIFKNHLARDILFLRRRTLYPAELQARVTGKSKTIECIVPHHGGAVNAPFRQKK